MLFAVKFFHTVIFLFMSACIAFIWYAGLNHVYDWRLGVAFVALFFEIVVFAFNGFRCPLTDLAIKLGDVDGGHDLIADTFLPRSLTDKVVPVSSVALILGVIVLVVGYFQ